LYKALVFKTRALNHSTTPPTGYSVVSEVKNYRGNASQFFIAGELCRRGYSAVVTLGNTPNTDILCSNLEGTKFVHIQVKTFGPNDNTC